VVTLSFRHLLHARVISLEQTVRIVRPLSFPFLPPPCATSVTAVTFPTAIDQRPRAFPCDQRQKQRHTPFSPFSPAPEVRKFFSPLLPGPEIALCWRGVCRCFFFFLFLNTGRGALFFFSMSVYCRDCVLFFRWKANSRVSVTDFFFFLGIKSAGESSIFLHQCYPSPACKNGWESTRRFFPLIFLSQEC